MQGKATLRWLGNAILFAIAATFGGNYITARLAFDHGANIATVVALGSSRH